LVIPKHHGAKLTDIPDDSLAEILPVVKKLVTATGAENYNVLQNNGRIAHQEVDHVSGVPPKLAYERNGVWEKRYGGMEVG
jgi:diadenosine tetraphosphate (Ap4A) HIT family hydrolase